MGPLGRCTLRAPDPASHSRCAAGSPSLPTGGGLADSPSFLRDLPMSCSRGWESRVPVQAGISVQWSVQEGLVSSNPGRVRLLRRPLSQSISKPQDAGGPGTVGKENQSLWIVGKCYLGDGAGKGGLFVGTPSFFLIIIIINT